MKFVEILAGSYFISIVINFKNACAILKTETVSLIYAGALISIGSWIFKENKIIYGKIFDSNDFVMTLVAFSFRLIDCVLKLSIILQKSLYFGCFMGVLVISSKIAQIVSSGATFPFLFSKSMLLKISIIVLIGALLTPIVSIAYFVLAVLGMIKYGQYKDYDYAFTINFIK